MVVYSSYELYSIQTEHIQVVTISAPDPSNQIPTEYLISPLLLVGSHKLTNMVPTTESHQDEHLSL